LRIRVLMAQFGFLPLSGPASQEPG
jgi:hypothetical protein